MVPRRDGHGAQKREDDYPSWVTNYDHMATTSPQTSKPTNDDDDDHSQYEPPSSVSWEPTPGVIPPWKSQYWITSTLVKSILNTDSQYASSGPTATVTATLAASDDGPSQVPSSTTFPGIEGGSIGDTQRKEESNHAPVYAAAGAVPVFVIAIIGFVVFFCMRKRRKQRRIAASQARVQEMKSQQPIVRAHMAPAAPISRAPSYTAPTYNMQRPISPPPVILGPIPAGSCGNYMTGIDTSDVMSARNERTGLGDPFADGNSLHEEPPPPYQPPSLVSRNSSLRRPRSSPSVSSQNSRQSHRQSFQPLSNPFEDPREDDAVSEMSGPTMDRNSDNPSIVSDLAYQQDPQMGRRAT